ncbi:peroxiredoxin-2F, mitochondrial [Andrographis paniculata]|uniref:peroxiredoxin-2F, mitochondrial n=1 Tax=Andrographis paniculata TaxID=175694 RepID=UPI0021E96655|nr:peroxiredoxin-2F, mitochondrial [Andrographis paniculata]
MAACVLLKRALSIRPVMASSQSFSSLTVGTDLISAAPDVSLQKARTWDEGMSSKFATTPIKEIFKDKKVVVFGLPGAYTGVCSSAHVPSYKNNIDKFKAKGVDSVVCVAVNDPFVIHAWAEKLQAMDAIEFYGDFDGSFTKKLGLTVDLSSALLGHRSNRWSAYVVNGKVQVLNVEKAASEINVSGGEAMLGQI